MWAERGGGMHGGLAGACQLSPHRCPALAVATLCNPPSLVPCPRPPQYDGDLKLPTNYLVPPPAISGTSGGALGPGGLRAPGPGSAGGQARSTARLPPLRRALPSPPSEPLAENAPLGARASHPAPRACRPRAPTPSTPRAHRRRVPGQERAAHLCVLRDAEVW